MPDDDWVVSEGELLTLWDETALKIYEGGPHGLAETHKDRLNADLLTFLGE